MAAAASKPGRTAKIILNLPCKLTQVQVQDAAKVLVEGMRQLEVTEEKKKTFNQQIKAELGLISATIESARSKVSSESEFREVECEILFFFNRNGGEKDFVRRDTGELVRTEKVNEDDRQERLA